MEGALLLSNIKIEGVDCHLEKMTQRDVMGREVGGGFMFGNVCKN